VTERTLTWAEAASRGDVATLERLLAAGTDINARDAHGQTALMLAALEGHERTVAFLADRGASLDQTAEYHLTALMLAVIRGHRWVAQSLVNAGADVTIRGSGAPGFEGKTALELAAVRGYDNLVEILRRADKGRVKHAG
jgi:ankyrin repeat protein